MPDRDVKTIKDLIFYQYAKIIVKSAMKTGDNETAKKNYYGLIKNKFRELQSGKISWSDIIREDLQFIDTEKKCIYCGSTENITKDHIIPKSICINDRCSKCDKIQGIHNIIWACKNCNSKKGTKGLYHLYHELYPDKKKSDLLPILLEKKYLKLMYNCHKCAGTLDSCDLNNDGFIDVLDIDVIIK
ncbi:MAG: HNH endonuclease [Bacteroidales bacterium]|nr:HNH endonuclease [Bacteroidales bacterium]